MGVIMILFALVLLIGLAVGGGVRLRLHERDLRDQDWWG